MKKSKGFTLVELVIVIAVIAILAGVMIGVFAGVVKSAKESARLQELKNQEIAQKAEDILAKVDNANWLGWEDLETKLASAVSDAISKSGGTIDAVTMKAAITEAVDAAIAKYASSIGTGNTGLTEEQVKFIVENAVSGKSTLTETQVKSIVNSAVAGLGTSTITKSQVQSIVENVVTAAQAKNLTAAQVTTIVSGLLANNNANIDTLVKAAVDNYASATLTSEQVEAIMQKYISSGTAKGDYTWYKADAKTLTITADADKAAEQLVALSTIANGGEDFAGQTVVLPKDAAITVDEWNPIGIGSYKKTDGFAGTIDGNGATVSVKKVDVIFNSAEGINGYTSFYGANSSGETTTNKIAYGFVNYLGVGGVLKDMTIVYDANPKTTEIDTVTYANPQNRYTYFGGAVGLLDGGTISNVTVTGSVAGYNRMGGLVGVMASGTIDSCTVSAKVESLGTQSDQSALYSLASGLIAFVDSGLGTCTGSVDCVIKNCNVSAATTKTIAGGITAKYIGWLTNNNMSATIVKNEKVFGSTVTNVKFTPAESETGISSRETFDSVNVSTQAKDRPDETLTADALNFSKGATKTISKITVVVA